MKKPLYASIGATIALFLACLVLFAGAGLLLYVSLTGLIPVLGSALPHRILVDAANAPDWMKYAYMGLLGFASLFGLLSAIASIAGRAAKVRSTSFLASLFPNLALLLLGGAMYAFLYLCYGLALPTMKFDLYMTFVEFGFLAIAIVGGLGLLSSLVIAKRGHAKAMIVFGIVEAVLGLLSAGMGVLAYLHFRAAGADAVYSCVMEDYAFMAVFGSSFLLGIANLLIACKKKPVEEAPFEELVPDEEPVEEEAVLD